MNNHLSRLRQASCSSTKQEIYHYSVVMEYRGMLAFVYYGNTFSKVDGGVINSHGYLKSRIQSLCIVKKLSVTLRFITFARLLLLQSNRK